MIGKSIWWPAAQPAGQMFSASGFARYGGFWEKVWPAGWACRRPNDLPTIYHISYHILSYIASPNLGPVLEVSWMYFGRERNRIKGAHR